MSHLALLLSGRQESEVKIGAGKFITQRDQIENKLKENTIGLVTLGDFQRLRKKLEKEQEDELSSSYVLFDDG
jgi:hypothetical protein